LTTETAEKPQNADRPAQTPSHEGSIKETLESIIIAFILAFVFRAFVVEAFVIPTGSMAPTLLGKHVSMQCEMCGYAFKSGPRDYREIAGHPVPLTLQGQQPREGQWYGRSLELHCPMCNHPISEQALRTQPGDRILVLKYIYAFQEPRRWDVVVFRNPERPAENYIKRLIGLPNEWLRIVRGNIYTSTDEGRTWQVRNKPETVQRVVWQPVYHSKYVPLDAEERNWHSPWKPTIGQWTVREFGRSFSFDGQGAGGLAFDFAQSPESARDYYAYNDLSNPQRKTTTFIEDLRVAVTVEAEQPGATFTAEMATDFFKVRGSIDAAGEPTLQLQPAGEQGWTNVGRKIASAAIEPGRPVRLELWQVDHRVTLFVDGDPVAQYNVPLINDTTTGEAFGITMDRLVNARQPDGPPAVAIQVTGSPMKLSAVNLDRDLYYTEQSVGSLGTHGNTAKLGADQFFCLGDNSPQSKDSRLWDRIDPWIPYHLGDYHHGEVPLGIVPRRLMIGRAFFVYFPSPLKLTPTSMPIIPNFGDLRFID